MRILGIVLTGLIFCAAPGAIAAADPVADGFAAIQRGDHQEAMRLFRIAAAQGDAKAQFNIGLMYAKGIGVPRDDREAVRWLRRAADQGLASAQHNLGNLYYFGEGVERDYGMAALWFRRAGAQGHAGAHYNLGVIHERGFGTPADRSVALGHYRQAAALGDADAEKAVRRLTRAAIAEAAPAAPQAVSATCEGLRTIASHVASVFEPLRGAGTNLDSMWGGYEGRLVLPGASSCKIQPSRAFRDYACEWTGLSAGAARARQAELDAEARRCFPAAHVDAAMKKGSWIWVGDKGAPGAFRIETIRTRIGKAYTVTLAIKPYE